MYVCIETIFCNEIDIKGLKGGLQNISCDHRGGLVEVAILAGRYRTIEWKKMYSRDNQRSAWGYRLSDLKGAMSCRCRLPLR